jgi:hypothetical protein
VSKESLAIYLQDHWAGAAAAVEILEALRDEHTSEALGQFAADLLMEIEADRAQLGSIVERLGGGSVLKETIGWLGARLAPVQVRARRRGAPRHARSAGSGGTGP